MKTLLLLLSFTVHADIVTRSFTPPTERVDGTELLAEDIAGYRLYLNDTSLPLLLTNNTFTLEITLGEHTVQIQTIDTDGRESTLSDTITVIGKADPKPQTIQ